MSEARDSGVPATQSQGHARVDNTDLWPGNTWCQQESAWQRSLGSSFPNSVGHILFWEIDLETLFSSLSRKGLRKRFEQWTIWLFCPHWNILPGTRHRYLSAFPSSTELWAVWTPVASRQTPTPAEVLGPKPNWVPKHPRGSKKVGLSWEGADRVPRVLIPFNSLSFT